MPDIQVVMVEYCGRNEIFVTKSWMEALNLNSSYLIYENSYKGSTIKASFWVKQILNFKIIKCPPFTPYNVQILHDWNSSSSLGRYNNEVHLLLELKQQLIGFAQVQLKLYPDILHAPIAFGSDYSFQYTLSCRILKEQDEDSLWKKIPSSTRNHILNAQEELTVEIKSEFCSETLNFLVSDNFYSLEGLTTIKLKAIEQLLGGMQHIKIISCKNRYGKLVSTSIFIKSESTWYYWINVNSKTERSRGAPSVLLWEGIRIALNDSCEFVFDGSMQPRLMKIFKKFSAESFTYCYAKANQSLVFRTLNI